LKLKSLFFPSIQDCEKERIFADYHRSKIEEL